MTPGPLFPLEKAGILSDLDRHFAALMRRLSDAPDPAVELAAALTTRNRHLGHVCLDLPAISGKPPEDAPHAPSFPDLDTWRKALERSSVIGRPGEFAPLILDNADRLYLHRYWTYQHRLTQGLLDRANQPPESIDALPAILDRYFPPANAPEPDLQRRAAETALTRRFCVISGGPGTGKTTTVAKILALFIEAWPDAPPRMALAAPTGKAAARMTAAVNQEKAAPIYDDVRDQMPGNAATIHRLLGAIPDSPYFRCNQDNPLPADVVVIDEASMVDMALMAKLIDALKPTARLLLLGDRDQLASVEAGAVLGDLCNTGGLVAALNTGVGPCIAFMEKNYRFGPDSGIGAVSQAVNAGNADAALDLLTDADYPDVQWMGPFSPEPIMADFVRAVKEGFRNSLQPGLDPAQVLQRLDQFRVLCGLRQGPFGATAINKAIEKTLSQAGLIQPTQTWYIGRPVMITRNDYSLGLFNGDVGVVLNDPEAGNDLRVFFPDPNGGVRSLHPLRLPDHETVYAMTVHKSQGSEFDHALLLLPDRDSPVLTRELIYTGLTRARKSISVWGETEVFKRAVERRIQRSSGLRDALWGNVVG